MATQLQPTKNREANEFRAQALALVEEIKDPTKALTMDELNTKQAAIKALNVRAQMAAEHTPDAEIERQGGDGDGTEVQRITPEAAATQDYPKTVRVQVDTLRKNLTRAFGGTANFCRAARGQSPCWRCVSSKKSCSRRSPRARMASR